MKATFKEAYKTAFTLANITEGFKNSGSRMLNPY